MEWHREICCAIVQCQTVGDSDGDADDCGDDRIFTAKRSIWLDDGIVYSIDITGFGKVYRLLSRHGKRLV